MTRRRFYAPPENFSDDRSRVTLDDEESRHLRDVLRLRTGDEVYVFDGRGAEFHGEVDQLPRRGIVDLRLRGAVEPARPESPLELTLALALLKGEKFDLVVQKATELGASQILPVATKRADVRLRDERDATQFGKRQSRLERLALEAAKQSGRARVPAISAPITLAQLIAAESSEGSKFMFAERNGGGLETIAGDERPPRVIALVGPEGGWEDEEIEEARRGGWAIVTLGGRTLRAETAAITVVVLLQNMFGDLR